MNSCHCSLPRQSTSEQMAEGSKKVVMANHPLIIAYHPIKQHIKLEILDENQEVNTAGEENRMLQPTKDPVVMANGPVIAYPPLKPNIKVEVLDDQQEQEVKNLEEHNWKLMQVPIDLVTSTGSTSANIESQTANASIIFDDSVGQSQQCLRDHHFTVNVASEKGESLQDTRMAEELGAEEEGSEYYNGSERSEHSSLEGFDESDNSLAADSTDDEDSIRGPKAGPSKEPTRRVEKADHRKTKGLKKQIEMPFKCSKCGSSYKQKRALDQHMKYECGVSFQCALCKQDLATKCSLRNHLLGIHNIARSKLDKYGAGFKDRSTQPYKCDRCGRTYKHKKSLASHLTVECGVNKSSFDCPRCDKRFKRKGDMKRHLIEIHQVEPSQLVDFGLGPVVRPENRFKCDRCGTSFTRNNNLKRHLTVSCSK